MFDVTHKFLSYAISIEHRAWFRSLYENNKQQVEAEAEEEE